MIDREKMVEAMAREIAAGDGWNYDTMPPDEERAPDGYAGHLQVDYDNRAEWALTALSALLGAEGHKVLPREPSHEMSAAMLSVLDTYDHMGGAMHDMFNAAHDAAQCLLKEPK